VIVGVTAIASPVYTLSGTLSWSASSAPDRLNINGESFLMTYTVTNPIPTNYTDPNGTQSVYSGVGTLDIGGVSIPLSSSTVSFFHSAMGFGDVANFIFTPVASDPAFYYPAVNLLPGANALASVAPPLYPANVQFSSALLVPGVDPSDPSGNSLYALQNAAFSSNPAVPEPSSFMLVALGFGLVGRVARVKLFG
jgi:hypothetical protein